MTIFQLIGNVFWVIFGGIEVAVTYFFAGFVMILTIIGIPFGVKLFQIGIYALMPFGARAITREPLNLPLALLFNILWIPFGLIISLMHLLFGILYFITIIGIPFGVQHFKLLGYAIAPFGREVVRN